MTGKYGMIDNFQLLELAERLKHIPHLNLTPYLPKVPLQEMLQELSQFVDDDFQPYTNGMVRSEYLSKMQSMWHGLCLIEYCKEGKHHIDYQTTTDHNLTFHSDNQCLPTDIGSMMPTTISYLQTIADAPNRTRLLKLYPTGDASWHSHYKLAKSGLTSIDGECVVNPVIQIPLVTNDKVNMLVSKENPVINRNCKRYSKYYSPGEVWVFNSYHYHNTVNHGNTARDHIMMYAQLDDKKLFPILEQAVREYHGEIIP
jgi:hypothetical protein